MRKNLYIIGARGFGREMSLGLLTWNGFSDQYIIKGFLDDKADALDGYQEGYPPIVSSVEAFRPGSNDVFLCALGAVKWRMKYIQIMLEKGAVFDTFISPNSYIKTSKIGCGVTILNHATISPDVRIGDFVLCHPHTILGHDVEVGEYTVLEDGVLATGGVKIGKRATLHTRATILPHQKVGDDSTVGACSCVIRNVKPGTVVFGNPAHEL